jgi:proline iminopeptidase
VKKLTTVKIKEIDGYKLSYIVEGCGVPTLVIGSSTYYSRVFSQNLRKHLKIALCDHRGFATANKVSQVSDFELDRLIDDFETIRATLNLDKMVVIGHSIHAFMALEYARRYPSNVSHLVLIGSSPIVGGELYQAADACFDQTASPERKRAFALTMERFSISTDPSFVARMLAFGPKLWFDCAFDAASLWEGVEVNPVGAGVIWGDMFSEYNVNKALSEIKCPVFLALGRHDYFNPPHLWDRYLNSPADLTLQIFENSGHTPQFEESEVFDDLLISWIQKSS